MKNFLIKIILKDYLDVQHWKSTDCAKSMDKLLKHDFFSFISFITILLAQTFKNTPKHFILSDTFFYKIFFFFYYCKNFTSFNKFTILVDFFYYNTWKKRWIGCILTRALYEKKKKIVCQWMNKFCNLS